MNELVQSTPSLSSQIVEKLVLKGDLSGLNQVELIQYYHHFCQRLGLDYTTKPFDVMELDGKKVMYAGRGCVQQLSKLHNVSHKISSREKLGTPEGEVYVVTAVASCSERQTESVGAVPLFDVERVWDDSKHRMVPKSPRSYKNLVGEAYCNALMKAETKAKRRATLDLLGLGMLDETEISSIQGAKTVEVDVSSPNSSSPGSPKAEVLGENEPKVPQRNQNASESAWENPWQVVPWHIGKVTLSDRKTLMKGKTLGEIIDLEPNALNYWAENFVPKEFRGRMNPKDLELRKALDQFKEEMGYKEEKKEAIQAQEDQAPEAAHIGLSREELLTKINSGLWDLSMEEAWLANLAVKGAKTLEEIDTETLQNILNKWSWVEDRVKKERG